MTERANPRIPEQLRQRVEASKPAPAGPSARRTGPSPSRIVAAAASVATGIGLVAVMAGSVGGQDTVVQVQPPQVQVTVQPVIGNATDGTPTITEVSVVQAATPALASDAPQSPPVTESEGS